MPDNPKRSFMLIKPSRQPMSQPAQKFVDMIESALNEAQNYCENLVATAHAAQ